MSLSIRAIAASLALICAATAAFAHAQLEKATPPVGGTVASATEIRLTFSEGVEPKFSGATLAAARRRKCAARPAQDRRRAIKRVLILAVAKALAAGVYTVHWRAVSVDTHHTQGTFQFTVKP